MSPANPIEKFLHGHMYDVAGGSKQPRLRPFVTISRQAGAGGHTLANLLVKKLDEHPDRELFGEWEVFDQKLVAMVADDPDLRVSVESLLGEEYRKATEDFFRQLIAATTHQDIVMDRMFRLVRAIAEVGRSVIVGRAGSEVTRGLGPAVSVRLVAPEEHRIKRMMQLYGLTEKEAISSVDRHDSGRARLLRRHFRVNIDNPLLYDAIWNTGRVPLEDVADSIIALLHTRAANWNR
jgi:cytidylate kinase